MEEFGWAQFGQRTSLLLPTEINRCLENNGGCHRYAECVKTGPGLVSEAFSFCFEAHYPYISLGGWKGNTFYLTLLPSPSQTQSLFPVLQCVNVKPDLRINCNILQSGNIRFFKKCLFSQKGLLIVFFLVSHFEAFLFVILQYEVFALCKSMMFIPHL